MPCPDLMSCDERITKDFFAKFCDCPSNSEIYLACHYLSKRRNWLKTPVEWIQRIAVENALQMKDIESEDKLIAGER